MDLFGDMTSILNSTVSVGMLRGQISMYFPPGSHNSHNIIQNGHHIAEKSSDSTKNYYM